MKWQTNKKQQEELEQPVDFGDIRHEMALAYADLQPLVEESSYSKEP